MAYPNLANGWTTTLAGSLTDVATTVDVASTSGIPARPFQAVILAEGANTDEIVTVTGLSGSTITISRATEANAAGSSSASAHASGATISHVLTAQALADLYAAAVASTHAYVGYNTVGGSWESFASNKVVLKKVTLASDCMLVSIEAYLRWNANTVGGYNVAVNTDNAGSIGLLIGQNNTHADASYLSATAAGTDNVGRWWGLAVGKYLTAGDYWIAFHMADAAGGQIAYDAGADRTYTSGGPWFADGGLYSDSDTSRKYSIRASTIK